MRDTSCRRIERSKLPLLSPTNDEGRRGRGLPESSVDESVQILAVDRHRMQPQRLVQPQPRNDLLAFFSFFAARFSSRLLAGFFLRSFLVSFALLMSNSPEQPLGAPSYRQYPEISARLSPPS